ncbi:TonB-dependent receptor [Algibacter sp. 2305UL17-15]|uniref:SusC/RagA family TonB-linked outer membrane protein n=1 Tax=Algibacter sp. 2305UL17-15 TaxID=3231268 RepID=UPI0034576780
MKKYFCLILFMLPFTLLAQHTIKGAVTDDNQLPLPGASILVKGTTTGAVTNFDGNFSIDLKSTPSTLLISYLGYVTKEVLITNQKNITIVLEGDQESLDEVVVIGYGEVKKKDLTGAITSIKPTEAIAEQSRGIEDVIRGRSAGVQVVNNGAEPGASISVRIRGLSSLTNNSEPLYVVDGIIIDSATEDTQDPLGGYSSQQAGLTGVNPQDIQSIEILKDASATAIYGSRAANGVVIITTKKGKKGTAKFNFTTTTSIGHVVRNIEVLDIEGFANYQNDAKLAIGQELPYSIAPNGVISTTGDDPIVVEGINWADDTYKKAYVVRNRLSVSGAGDKTNYYVSGGMTRNQGTFPNALAEAFDVNANIKHKFNDKFSIKAKAAATFTELQASKGTDETGGANNSMVRQVILAAPILNFTDNNNDAEDVDEILDGPRAWTQEYDDDATETRLLASVDMQYRISKTLKYRLLFGGDYRTKERKFFFGTGLRKGRDPNGIAGVSTLDRFRYNIDNTILYNKRFNKNHRINATAGFLIDKTHIETSRFSASDFPDLSLRADGINTGRNQNAKILGSESPTILSFIGRANYTLADKYLFTGTFRADGSSRFPKGNQWGYFPAFSFAWKVMEEPFLKDQKTISNLKLRTGYGEVGNQNIASYRFLSIFNRTENSLADSEGNGTLIPIIPQNLANEELKWETSKQYNLGVDFGFFDDRINGTVDVYEKKSSDLLLSVPLGPSTGFNALTANQGGIENRGLEISLNADVIRNKNTNWNVFANISFNRNKITSLGLDAKPFGALGNIVAFEGTQIAGGTTFKQPANIFIEGEEAALFYGYETNGIIRTNTALIDTPTGDPLTFKGQDLQVGDVQFVDKNNDGNIDENDKTIIGNPNPDYTFGFGSSFEYKNLSLSVLFNGVYGNDLANGNSLENAYANTTPRNVRSEAYYDAFNAVLNPNGKYPFVGVNGTGYTSEFNDRAVESGSFLRLSYVTLGYNVPLKSNLIDSLKFTLSGQNLWLLTDYTGFDPEVSSFAYDPLRSGVDWGSFPNQRTYAFGLNITF